MNVFLGPNEAGKSTLLNFVRSMWFGFDRRGQPLRGEPLRGGRHGGRLLVGTQGGASYTVERLGGDSGPSAGSVTVSDASGNQFDEELLPNLLGSVSRDVFYSVFAFGLTELEQLDTLHKDEISQALYSAGLGTPVPVTDVEQNLTRQADQLFRPAGSKPTINQLVDSLDAVSRKLSVLRKLPDEYSVVKEEERELLISITQLEQRRGQLRQELLWCKALMSAWEQWEELLQVENELNQLPVVPELPPATVQRMQQLEQRILELKAEVAEREEQTNHTASLLAAISEGEALLRARGEVRHLQERKSAYEKNLQQAETLRRGVEQKSRQVAEGLRSLGGEWSEQQLMEFDTGLQARETVREFARRVQATKEQLERARIELDTVKANRRKLAADFEEASRHKDELIRQSPASPYSYETRCAAAQSHSTLQTEMAMLASERDRIERCLDALHKQAGEPEPAAPPSCSGDQRSKIALAGGVLLTLTSAALFVFEEALAAGALGVLGAAVWVVFAVLRLSARTARVQLTAAANAARAHIRGQQEYWRVELERIDASVGDKQAQLNRCLEVLTGTHTPSAEQTSAAIAELEVEGSLRTSLTAAVNRCEALAQEDRLVARAQEEAARAYQDALQQHRKAEDRFQTWLQSQHLSPALSADGVLEVIQMAQTAKDARHDQDETQSCLDALEAEIGEFVAGVNLVCESCGRPPVSRSEAAGTVTWLNQTLDQVQMLTTELTSAKEALGECQEQLRQHQAAVEDLLAQAEAESIGDFYIKGEVCVHRQSLEERRRRLVIAIGAKCGQWNSRVRGELEQTQLEELRQKAADLSERLASTEAQITEGQTSLGSLRQRLDDMEKDEQLSLFQMRADTLVEELQCRAWEWQRLAIARALLAATREKYEKERQPEVLQTASQYFRAMTGGCYTRVYAPVGQQEIRVETNDRQQIGVEQLSRGTVEQLYLAMRLALAREFGRRSVPLPLVMDDVVVNFDPQRLRQTSAVLGEVARCHQILFFTCHPHVAQALVSAGDARLIELAAGEARTA